MSDVNLTEVEDFFNQMSRQAKAFEKAGEVFKMLKAAQQLRNEAEEATKRAKADTEAVRAEAEAVKADADKAVAKAKAAEKAASEKAQKIELDAARTLEKANAEAQALVAAGKAEGERLASLGRGKFAEHEAAERAAIKRRDEALAQAADAEAQRDAKLSDLAKLKKQIAQLAGA